MNSVPIRHGYLIFGHNWKCLMCIALAQNVAVDYSDVCCLFISSVITKRMADVKVNYSHGSVIYAYPRA